MNDLDRQLAELAMINKAELSPNPTLNTTNKKVGPAVPPKPKKTQPQVTTLIKLSLFRLFYLQAF